MVNDLIIIGGGASGLCAAVYFKQKNPNANVRILESGTRVGKKLALTGNGRCNITNSNIELSRYHGNNVEFCRYALEKYDRFVVEDFFSQIGVNYIFEGEKAYPSSLQAASVVDCLRFAADELGVITHLESKVSNITISKGNYKVICDKLSFLSKKVIVAAGLLSGGERLGCDGKMLELLKNAGFKTVKTSPAIVQLKTETETVKQLKGIKIDADVTLLINGKKIRTEFGETLFCDYGLSGPPILQISRGADVNQGKCEISLDIMPNSNFNDLFSQLESRAKNLKNRNVDEFFTGMLNKRVGQVLLKLSGCKLTDKVSTIDAVKLKKLVSLIKDWRFTVTGNTGYANSQVTAGGLDTTDFFDNTMECRSAEGLYAIGEILDIDGDCGGFNLQWAWSSAMCAADAISEELK